ncbi:hypothetical protein INQ41_06940 [Lysobacter ciconiae]|uniref:Uncharacterized protein n=1 Tax=Novilysobacter ciconiae TaxID=2781022 RepID=A0A7S6ZR94_9GAMM|nr:BPSL0761 family protein [Lysobacter ciconiae]QOW18467.1 hypothetical protein INQ41_06940 [Lysobacter ciconiae]
MSTPDERTLCVLQTRRFLRSLRSDHTLPEPVRQESHRLLRHYPSSVDIHLEAALQAKGMRGMCFDPEIDPGWWREYPYGPVTKECT